MVDTVIRGESKRVTKEITKGLGEELKTIGSASLDWCFCSEQVIIPKYQHRHAK